MTILPFAAAALHLLDFTRGWTCVRLLQAPNRLGDCQVLRDVRRGQIDLGGGKRPVGSVEEIRNDWRMPWAAMRLGVDITAPLCGQSSVATVFASGACGFARCRLELSQPLFKVALRRLHRPALSVHGWFAWRSPRKKLMHAPNHGLSCRRSTSHTLGSEYANRLMNHSRPVS